MYRTLHHIVDVDRRRVVPQRLSYVSADGAFSHEVEEVEVFEALEGDGAESWQP